MWCQHQTRQAAKGVRARGKMQWEDSTEVSVQLQVICHFHKVIKAEQQKGPGVRDGLIDGASAPDLEKGNSANAAASATAVATQVSLFLIIVSKP